MKKWFYIVLPVVMAGIFAMFYVKHAAETEQRVARNEAEKKAKMEAELKVKTEAEAKAKESAKIAQEERDRETAAREAARKAQQDAVDAGIKEKTDKAMAEIDAASKKSKALEAELDRLIKDRERIEREPYDHAKQVELAMVTRRTAEMEEQRLTEMIARRASDSSMARPPPPPPPPPAAAKGRFLRPPFHPRPKVRGFFFSFRRCPPVVCRRRQGKGFFCLRRGRRCGSLNRSGRRTWPGKDVGA